ncbi:MULTISPECIES: LysR family transcriptional regulator [unclassified Methylobacterium]|uniref:LysR family transcriptional regulator n=1 Tax=unclassified Methylobacterium TaxID=2615210 RepID=UPI0006F2ED49|nr:MULTISPECIES: LysR family transcriptional regulator [unclassified Methylobacterium]KQO58089.1 LysR family transcriptional regulator [Methylobacterium sp. Leaf86]KQO85554.1 LysR family transcriptional regulator [Methylobacterium sp. Leaf91]
MDLDWLKDFLALAEQKTFSRAAEARSVTQPAFSRRIRALEDWVGTPLFARGAQGAALTPAGVTFLPAAQALLHSLERARRETRAVGAQDTATLSIAATHALSFTFFPSWVRRVMRSRTLGTLNLISDSMEACEQIMLSGEVHFLLCHFHGNAPTRFEPDRFESVRVGDDRLIPLCAPSGDGAGLWSLPGSSAEPVPYLAYSQASGLGRILASCRNGDSFHLDTRFTSHLAATLTTMAREGHGVAWLPQTVAADDQTRGRLVRAGHEQFDVPIEIRLFRSLECRNHAADELWDYLTEAQTS